MWIISNDGKTLINSNKVMRFCIDQKADNALIVAINSKNEPPTTIGRFADEKDAFDAMVAMTNALIENKDYFEMPEKFVEGHKERYNGKKPKTHGGS